MSLKDALEARELYLQHKENPLLKRGLDLKEIANPMTNGDRIRAMTDEEIICACAKLPICPPKTVSDCEFHCTSCWREYIQQPYKRDAE